LKYDHRLIIDTILYVLVSGCACLFVPLDLDPWHAAYRWFATASHWQPGTHQIPDGIHDVAVRVGHRQPADVRPVPPTDTSGASSCHSASEVSDG
jgi:hypothetical protein